MSRIKGITIELGGDTTKLDKAIKDVNKSARALDKELRGINYALKLDPKNVEMLAQKNQVLATRVEEAAKKVDILKQALKEASDQFARGEISDEEFRKIARETAIAEGELKKYSSQLKEFNNTMKQTGEAWQKTGDKMVKVGKTLSTKVTAPIVAFGGLATKAASDYESAFAGVRKTTDATEEEFAMLSDGIREMAKELPSSATSIAEVMEAAGQLGIEVPNLLEFTRVMIDLGESTNMSATEGATQFARFANIVGMSQSDFSKLGSVVVDLGNNFATTEEEIVDMAMGLAGAGAQVGLTEAEIMSFAAALSSVGVEAAAGGSAFSKVMINMQLAVETGSDELENFASVAGMSAAEFSTAFKEDATSAITAFVQGLATSEERGMSAIAVLDEMGITEVRLRDALLRAAGASDTFTEAVATGNTAWQENTALTDEANQRYETFESKMSMLKNQLADIGITLGEHLMPHIEKFAEWLGNLAERFGNLDESTQETIIVIAALAAAIGPLLIILGTVIKVGGLVMTAISGIGTVLTVLTGPVGIAIAAIAGVIAIGVALWKNWDKIKEFALNMWESLKQTFERIKETISGAWNSVKNWTSNTWASIRDTISNLVDSIRTKITNVFDGVKSKISGVWDSIKSTTKNAWDSVKNFITDPINKARDAVKNAIDKVKSILSGKLSFPKIKLPRFSLTGKFSLVPPSVPKIGIDWYDKGGIFSAPTVIGVGEKRPEFVGALEDLRYLIGDEMDKRRTIGDININLENVHVHDDRDIENLARELAWNIRKELNLETI